MRPRKQLFPLAALALTGVLAAAPGVPAQEKPAASAGVTESPEVQAVNALNALFGVHPGFRANHAKGIVLEGSFTAAPDAAKYSTAPHLQGGTVPVVVRFSDATGLPNIPDGSPDANPHGLAIKFRLPGGAETDIVVNSLHFFPVRTVPEFVEFLQAAKASPPGAPKPTKLDRFFAAHPVALKALGTAATPTSFATETYFGLDAFQFINKTGEKHYFRYRIEPFLEPAHLSPEQAQKQPPNFLMDDIAQRVKQGEVRFHLRAQLAQQGDPINDATQPWPADRPVIDLGVLTINKLVPQDTPEVKTLLFLPGRVVTGIAPSDDPLIAGRDGAYAVSYARRLQP